MKKRTLIGAALAALLAIPAIAWASGAGSRGDCPCGPSCPLGAHKR